MSDYEKLGAFYLGKPYDLPSRQRKIGLLLYDSKDLVTHAACFGMTGSGKTAIASAVCERARTFPSTHREVKLVSASRR